jgi:hypothetical protein
VTLAGLDIARVALEAEAQNLGMTQFLTQTVTTAGPCSAGCRKARNRVGPHTYMNAMATPPRCSRRIMAPPPFSPPSILPALLKLRLSLL